MSKGCRGENEVWNYEDKNILRGLNSIEESGGTSAVNIMKS